MRDIEGRPKLLDLKHASGPTKFELHDLTEVNKTQKMFILYIYHNNNTNNIQIVKTLVGCRPPHWRKVPEEKPARHFLCNTMSACDSWTKSFLKREPTGQDGHFNLCYKPNWVCIFT